LVSKRNGHQGNGSRGQAGPDRAVDAGDPPLLGGGRAARPGDGQAIARRVGVNAADLECLDLILMSGPSTAGNIARRTGLTSGAVTGLIDRLEKLELVERTADPDDRRKVRVKVRQDKIEPIAALFSPMGKSTQALLAGYSREELKLLVDFAERAGDLMLHRVTELNESK
jgi:DNA-binding MarR family transcriptional regulator